MEKPKITGNMIKAAGGPAFGVVEPDQRITGEQPFEMEKVLEFTGGEVH